MRKINRAYLILFLGMFGFLSLNAQSNPSDCKQTLSDVENLEPVRLDTFNIRHPESKEITIKVVKIYIPGERKFAKVEKVDDLKVFYIKENDCLMIRHTEWIKQ